MLKRLLILTMFNLFSFIALSKDIRVLVIDSGVDKNNIQIKSYLADTNDSLNWRDNNGHGTHIAGIIATSGCPKLKIYSCKFFNVDSENHDKRMNCFNNAISQHYDIVNFSAGGEFFEQEEYDVIKKLTDTGTKVIVSAGNNNTNLGSPCFGYFPACFSFNNLITVGALDEHGTGRFSYGKFKHGSNYGKPGMVWEIGENVFSTLPDNHYGRMSGTSQATANYTRSLVKEMCYK